MTQYPIKVLFIEDNEVAKTQQVKTIQQFGCHIETANSGAQALEYLTHNKYDLIFMDLFLPDIDGLTLTETIRAAGKNKSVPIVALTAHGENQYQNQAVWTGMDLFIIKPLTIENCQKILETFCERETS